MLDFVEHYDNKKEKDCFDTFAEELAEFLNTRKNNAGKADVSEELKQPFTYYKWIKKYFVEVDELVFKDKLKNRLFSESQLIKKFKRAYE